jgi:predicted RNase H-like HicB family nuclease
MIEYQFTVVIEPDEHGFHAFVPALPGCHSFGGTVEEAQANIHEAMELHVEAMIEDGEPVPMQNDPVFITRISIPIAA